MSKRVISDLVDPVAEKQMADPSKPQPYIGLEHIPEKAIAVGPIGYTSNIRGMCVRFCEGDILFGKLRPNLRKCVRAPVNGLGSTEILVLRAKPEADPGFAAHVLRSEGVFSVAERLTEGTRMPRTSWKTVSDIRVFAPEGRAAQKLIAEILDAAAPSGRISLCWLSIQTRC
jgi:type I restriction enzyme S subunit